MERTISVTSCYREQKGGAIKKVGWFAVVSLVSLLACTGGSGPSTGPSPSLAPDSDGDGVSNADEISAGSDPLDPLVTAEICDGADNDRDGLKDEGFPDVDIDGIADCVDPQVIIETFTLTVTKAAEERGSLTSSPVGIDCGADCSESYIKGTVVTLIPTPAPGWILGGFGGDADCSDGVVVVMADLSCIPIFLAESSIPWPNQQEKPAAFEWAPYVTPLTGTTIVVGWRTVGQTTGEVTYGFNLEALDQSKNSATPTQQHFVTLESLLPGTTYFYRVTVSDGSSMEGTFTTSGVMPIRFVHFAEYHAPSKAEFVMRWSDLIRQFRPHLAVDSGDMVNNGDIFDDWWGWFDAGKAWLPYLLTLPLSSNHVPISTEASYLLRLFQLPDKDEAGIRRPRYSIRYGAAQFLMVGAPSDSSDALWLAERVKEANDGVDDPLFLICSWHEPGQTALYTPFTEPYGGVDLILVGHHKHTVVSKKTGAGRKGLDVWQVQTAMGNFHPHSIKEDEYTLQYSNNERQTMLFVEINHGTLSGFIKDWDGNALYSFQIVK